MLKSTMANNRDLLTAKIIKYSQKAEYHATRSAVYATTFTMNPEDRDISVIHHSGKAAKYSNKAAEYAKQACLLSSNPEYRQ